MTLTTQPPQQHDAPHREHELHQFLERLSRDICTAHKEFRQRVEPLMVMQVAAYAELEQIAARKRDTFPWVTPLPPRSPNSMPLPERREFHLHAGMPGRMGVIVEAEEVRRRNTNG